MKTTAIPSVRVAPEVRADIESLLREGETLSQFVESSVRDAVRRRRANAEFLARGMAAMANARASGIYVEPEDVLKRLETKLAAARQLKATR